MAYTRLGRLDEAAARLAAPTPDALFRSVYGLLYLYAKGQYQLATGHHHAALTEFLSCGELVRAWGLDMARLAPWRVGAAAAWLRLGNSEQAKQLLREQLSGPCGCSAHDRGLSLRILAAAGPPNRRPLLLAESAELLENCGDCYEQARALADLAEAFQQLGETRRARVVFRRAARLANLSRSESLRRELMPLDDGEGEGEGGTDATAAASGQSATAGHVPDPVSTLSESERRVASLATLGYTNREIAAKLFITASTVEQHLTRVYRKLGVKDRRGLPTDLGRPGPAARRTA
jgi:DNA-binding CsgD family transcriptional regulator